MKDDKRPDPKPRKHPLLWQSYLWWDELMQMQKRHKLRLSSINRGKSNLDGPYEQSLIDFLTPLENDAKKSMIAHGKNLGTVWDWMTSIKGVGDHTAAKILAQFDDVGKFATISKFWRFSGWGVIDGKIDRCAKGETSPYNRRLKSECYLIAEQFIRHQTPVYADIYYAEKERQRKLHPDVMCRDCGCKWDDCQHKKKHKRQFNNGHLHHRAMRKTVKIFLSHLWQVWRETEGLSVSEPYIAAIGGHSNIVPVPNWK